jgi:hypothetical protein
MTRAAEHTAASDRRASIDATSRVVRDWFAHWKRGRPRRALGIAAMHDGGPYVRARCADRHRFFERQPETSARPEVSRRDGHSMGMGLAGAGARLVALGACLCLGACGEPGSLARGAGGMTGPTPLVEAALPANQGAAATRPSRGRLNQAATPPRVQHVVTIVLENTDYEQAIAQPFLAQLARNGGLLTNYSAVAHPSEPNYFALTTGRSRSVRGRRSDGAGSCRSRCCRDSRETHPPPAPSPRRAPAPSCARMSPSRSRSGGPPCGPTRSASDK